MREWRYSTGVITYDWMVVAGRVPVFVWVQYCK